ncbi:MAG: hypothetical protein NT154_05935 [Verrucomicrobia bacterium]|nr:hypothetical protein [Verrucomicrobiota bacterium]
MADRSSVVLEVVEPRHATPSLIILSESQRQGDVEVIRIAPDKGSVELRLQEANRATLRLQNATNLPVPGIVLEDAGINAVLQLFAQYTNRSLLCWPDLPATSFSLRASAKDQAGGARILGEALLAKDFSIIPDGEKFLMVVPKSEAARAKPHAPLAKALPVSETKTPAATPGSGGTGQELLPPGMIDFRGADVHQVADVYAMMLCRQFDHSERLPAGEPISFKTQTSITKEEGICAGNLAALEGHQAGAGGRGQTQSRPGPRILVTRAAPVSTGPARARARYSG